MGNLYNIFPRLPADYRIDSLRGNVVSDCYLPIGHARIKKTSHFSNFHFGKFCPRVSLSAQRNVSSFLHFISIVILSGTYKKVARIAARSVIAFMASAGSILYLSICKLPSVSVSKYTFVHDLERPVSSGIAPVLPFPATFLSVILNTIPKINPKWGFVFEPFFNSITSTFEQVIHFMRVDQATKHCQGVAL